MNTEHIRELRATSPESRHAAAERILGTDDPLVIALALEEAAKPENGMLARFKAATNCSEPEIVALVGKARATVNAYIAGTRNELLSREDLEALRRYAIDQCDKLDRLIAEIDLDANA